MLKVQNNYLLIVYSNSFSPLRLGQYMASTFPPHCFLGFPPPIATSLDLVVTGRQFDILSTSINQEMEKISRNHVAEGQTSLMDNQILLNEKFPSLTQDGKLPDNLLYDKSKFDM